MTERLMLFDVLANSLAAALLFALFIFAPLATFSDGF
jgi:hypothetical protein